MQTQDQTLNTKCKSTICDCNNNTHSMDLYQEKLQKEKADFIANLAKEPPFECAFKLGDKVTFTNDYGIEFKGYEIVGFEKKDSIEHDRFIYTDKESYWFPHKASQLKVEV